MRVLGATALATSVCLSFKEPRDFITTKNIFNEIQMFSEYTEGSKFSFMHDAVNTFTEIV